MSLNYLSNNIVYLGSHLGDSQLLAIDTAPHPTGNRIQIPGGIPTVSRNASTSTSRKGKERAADSMEVDEETDNLNGRIIEPEGSYLTVLQSFKNLGPIVSAVLADVEGSGQVSQIASFSA